MTEIYRRMKERLGAVVPDTELWIKAPIVEEILKLKAEKDAVILGHNYMEPALFHTVPDYVGDSLELSRKAAATNNTIVVFLGVRFMAETAKLLCPDKTVLLPSEKGGCSLAASLNAGDVRSLRRRYPGVPVVSYINTYADVKAESDICCTSGNATEVVNSLNSDTVIFLPDEYLALNVARETGKKIIRPKVIEGPLTSEKDSENDGLIIWHGRCEVHERYIVEDIERVKGQFSDVVVLAHPECSPEVVEASDFSGSTNAMAEFVKHTKAGRYLLLTECSMGDNLAAAVPEKEMIRLCSIRCPHMNEITLEETRDSLKYDRYAIEIPETIRDRARRAVERMLTIP